MTACERAGKPLSQPYYCAWIDEVLDDQRVVGFQLEPELAQRRTSGIKRAGKQTPSIKRLHDGANRLPVEPEVLPRIQVGQAFVFAIALDPGSQVGSLLRTIPA